MWWAQGQGAAVVCGGCGVWCTGEERRSGGNVNGAGCGVEAVETPWWSMVGESVVVIDPTMHRIRLFSDERAVWLFVSFGSANHSK